MLRMDLRADRVPAEVADETGAKRIERGHPAVDVEVALLARGQSEGAGADGFLEQQLLECRGGVEHGRRVDGGPTTSSPERRNFSGGMKNRRLRILSHHWVDTAGVVICWRSHQ